MRDHLCGCNAWPQGKKVSCRSIDTTISFKPNRCVTASSAFPLTTKDVEPGKQVSCERLKTDSVQGRNDLKDNERELEEGGVLSVATRVSKKSLQKKKSLKQPHFCWMDMNRETTVVWSEDGGIDYVGQEMWGKSGSRDYKQETKTWLRKQLSSWVSRACLSNWAVHSGWALSVHTDASLGFRRCLPFFFCKIKLSF